jgi:hypothetical protein
MNILEFRRQFLFCNKQIPALSSWKQEELSVAGQNFTLYLHPDLEYYRTKNNDAGILLMGYAIDPYHPDYAMADILKELASRPDYTGLLKRTDTLTGRYAIIHHDEDSIQFCHDATGLREVYYYNYGQVIACGSTSKIIADSLNIPLDDDPDLVNFYKSEIFNKVGRRWIGNRTVYKNIYHLPPNHYLDLLPGKTYRFWPTENRKEKELSEAALSVANILSGTYDAATSRFKLQQGLTGGWDTRLLLAASRKYVDRINFYFYQGFLDNSTLNGNADYQIARKIAEKAGISLEIIRLDKESTEDEFEKIYFQNNVFARPTLLPVYYYNNRVRHDGSINVSGSGSNEILRLLSSIHRVVKAGRVIAGDLGYDDYPYAVNAIDEWLKENFALTGYQYKLVDLFNWEQHFGNWGSLSSSEQDIVMEELRPFDNRELISNYLSVHDRYRYKDYPLLHVAAIKLLWEDLMIFDVYTKWPEFKKILRKLGVEQSADRLFQYIKLIK